MTRDEKRKFLVQQLQKMLRDDFYRPVWPTLRRALFEICAWEAPVE